MTKQRRVLHAGPFEPIIVTDPERSVRRVNIYLPYMHHSHADALCDLIKSGLKRGCGADAAEVEEDASPEEGITIRVYGRHGTHIAELTEAIEETFADLDRLMGQLTEKKPNILRAVKDVIQYIDNDIGVDDAPAGQVQVGEAAQSAYRPAQDELQAAVMGVIPATFAQSNHDEATALATSIASSLVQAYPTRPEVAPDKHNTPEDPLFSHIAQQVGAHVTDTSLAKHLTGEIFDAVQKVYTQNKRQRF